MPDRRPNFHRPQFTMRQADLLAAIVLTCIAVAVVLSGIGWY
ncbi:MAG: hypothetical protein AAFQ45_02145 [Pseudomonadota bacterium]